MSAVIQVNPTVVLSGSGERCREPLTASPGGGTPTGKVQFRIDGHIIGGPVTLSHGRATLTVGYVLTLGGHPITATYVGTASYLSSVSPTYTHNVHS